MIATSLTPHTPAVDFLPKRFETEEMYARVGRRCAPRRSAMRSPPRRGPIRSPAWPTGAAWTMTCRTTDLAARYGGEEFALLLPETALADALIVAERIREAIRGRPIDIDVPVRLHLPVTASLGVASLGEGIASGPALCAAADAALYRAKAAGRDRVLSA